MSRLLQNLLRNATRLTYSGRLMDATAAIQRVLRGQATRARPASKSAAKPPHSAPANVLDDCVFEMPQASATSDAPSAPRTEPRAAAQPQPRPHPHPQPAGTFTSGTHQHVGLTRAYKLFTPAGPTTQPQPLLVMLHGCTQNPDDFAAGTGMNRLAQEQGFCVLYPEQSTQANPQRCWNWFKHNHQARGHGETAFIASLTQAVMQAQGSDPQRIYIAGLSAGGAMAALVGAAYPELFAAVAVHSGLAPGAAQNLPEAMAAMKGRSASGRTAHLPLPVIVFHGDQDRTVHPHNGEQIMQAAQDSRDTSRQQPDAPRVEKGVSANGQRFTRTLHGAAEHWLLHGAGHAWSGGHASGSYTDPRGPDASREMLRFFSAHAKLRDDAPQPA